MYSYADRIRAVKLYIKRGKRTGPTILQLGNPTKNSLKGWHREYERDRDFQVDTPVLGRSTPRNKYRWQFSITLIMIVVSHPP